MAQSSLYTAPNLALKVQYEKTGEEKLVGYARGLNFSVNTGLKQLSTVDSPIPEEIALGAGPSSVNGNITLYFLKGTDPIRMGIVPPTVDRGDLSRAANATSRYMHWRLYDRLTQELVFAVDFCKIASYSVSVQSKNVVEVQAQFVGLTALNGEI